MGIEDIYWITPEFSVIIAGVVGLLVGSFLNVVIHRLPLMMQAQWEAELEEALAQQNPAAADAAGAGGGGRGGRGGGRPPH